MNKYRQAKSEDIIKGAIVYMKCDDGRLHRKIVYRVLRPDDDWKAFCADDGCRYGLDGCFITLQRRWGDRRTCDLFKVVYPERRKGERRKNKW